MTVKDDQISGNHYQKYMIQPLEFIMENNLPYAEGNVIKYICRHHDKDGVIDLKKAKHYIDWMLEEYYGETE